MRRAARRAEQSSMPFPAPPPTTDLAIVQLATDRPAGVALDGTITYTFDVRSLGPATAAAVLTDNPGYGETLVSAAASQGTCSQVAPVTCSLDAAPAGGGWTVTIVTRATRPGNITHVGTVRAASGSTNSNMTNDMGTASTAVIDNTPANRRTFVATTGLLSAGQVSLTLGGRVVPD